MTTSRVRWECDVSNVASSATEQVARLRFMLRSSLETEHSSSKEVRNTYCETAHHVGHGPNTSIACMLDSKKRIKIKNNNRPCWWLEMASFSYAIEFMLWNDYIGQIQTLPRERFMQQQPRPFCKICMITSGVQATEDLLVFKNLSVSWTMWRKFVSPCIAELKPRFYNHSSNKRL